MTSATKPPWPDDAEIEAVVRRAAKLAFRHGLLAGFLVGIVVATVAYLAALVA